MNRCQQKTKIRHRKCKYTGLSECSINQWMISDQTYCQHDFRSSCDCCLLTKEPVFIDFSCCNADIQTLSEPQSSFTVALCLSRIAFSRITTEKLSMHCLQTHWISIHKGSGVTSVLELNVNLIHGGALV